MATGGMSFKGGNYQMNVSLDASKALDVAKELDAVLEKVGTTLRNISRGRDVSELWNQQAASIDNVAQALERYSKNVNSVGNAEDLIKSLNAFKAWNPEIKDVDIFSQLREGAEELISTAGKLAANLDSAFDVPSLRNAFDAFEALKSAGVDVSEIVAKLGQGDMSNLTNQIEQLERQLSSAQMRARDLQEQVNSYESGAAFEEMREKLAMLEEATERAQYEFRDFLSSIGFAGREIDPSNNWGQFHDWFEAIANGSLTAKEAIAQFKRENAGMFDTVSQSDLSMIVDRMEQFGSAIEEIRNSLTQLGATGSLSDMERTFAQSSEAAKQQNAELAQVGANAAVLETLIQELTRLAEANMQSGEAAQTANNSLVQLLGSLERLSSTDPAALESLAEALRSISRMDGVTVGKSSMQNLVSALESLSRLTNTSSLTALSTVDLRNFNDLHISKASLSNMAEFLPTISGTNVGALQQLASIDWSGLNSLNISKASVSSLSQLLSSVGANGLNLTGMKISLDETGLSSLSKSIEDAIQRASQNIKLTIDNVELSAAAQKKIAEAASAAQTGGSGRSGNNNGGNSNALKAEQQALNNLISLYQQYYALESKKISAVNKGDIDNADVYRARANAIWEEIARVEELNPKLAELAGQHEKVTEAVRKWQAAVNSGQARSDSNMARRVQEEAKALEEYQKQIDRLGTAGTGGSSIKFSGDTAALAQYEAELQELQNRFQQIATAAETEKSAAVAAFEEQRQKVEDLRTSLNSMASSAKEAATLSQQYATFRNQLQAFTVANPKAYNLNKAEIDSWFAAIDSGANQSSTALQAMKLRFTEINGEMRTMGTQGKTVFQQLKAGWQKFGGWSIVTKSFTKIISTMKQAVTAVKEVDAAMTELRKVTDLTETQYDSLYNKMVAMSGQVGSKLSDVISSVGDFSRLGYNAAEALSLSEAALTYFNVGDQLENINEATESLISTMKAFGIEANDAMSIVDMFNEVGNNFAISSSGIGEALMRSASALATAGNSIEESIGLIVAANDVVQNPEAVGTAMKTLSMYMRTMKTEAEEAGLSTDGMAESTSKLRAELLALTGGKLDIQIDDQHLKSTYQVLQELSEIWDEIGRVSENNQARILEMLGGKRNANVLSSIITNFDDAVAAMETAGNSAGSAWMENEKYLNSVEGKTKQVQAAFEAFANSVINSDVVKTWLDIQKGILNAGSALNEIGMLLPTIAAGMTAIKGIMDSMKASNAANQIVTYLNAGNAPNSDSIQSIIAGLTKGQQKALSINLGNLIQTEGAVTGLQDVVDLLNRNVGATNTFKSSLASMGATAKTVFAGIKASMMSMGIAALVSLAIEGIVKLVQWVSTAKQRAVEAAQEVNKAYSDQESSTSENIKRLERLEEEYNELNAKAGANGAQGSLNASEYERYKNIIEEIAAISPNVVAGFTKEGAALKDYNTVIQDAITYQSELLDTQKRVMVNDAEKVYSGARAQISDLYKEMKKYSYEIYDAFSPTHGNIFGNKGTEEARNWLSILDTVGIKLDEIVEKTGTKNVKYHTSTISDVWLRSYDYLEQVYAKQDQIREAMIASGNYEVNQVSDVVNKISNLSKILPKYESYIKSVQNVLVAYADTDIGLSSILDRDTLTPEQLDMYYEGIMQIADASKTFGDQKKEVEAFTRLFAGLYNDIDYAKGAGTFDLMWSRWGELQEKYKESPYLLGIIQNALFGVTQASEENATAVANQAKSYEQLAASMENISKATSFLNNLRSDNKDTFSLIKSAQEFIDMYNGIFTGEGEQIDLSSMFSFDEDGMPSWDTNAVEIYTEAIVRAAFADTTFAQENPEVVDALVAEATAFQNASKAAVTFADAASQANNIASIRQDIDEFLNGNGTDADKLNIISEIDTVIEKWNELGKARAEMTEGGEEWTDVTLHDFFGEGLDDMDLAKEKLSEFAEYILDVFSNEDVADDSLIELLRNVMTAMAEAEEKAYSLSDAMSALSSVSKFLTEGFDTTNPLSAIDEALGVLENWNAALKSMGQEGNKSLADLLVIGDTGGVTEKAGALKQVYTDLANAAIDANDKLTEVEKSALKAQVGGWVTAMLDAEAVKEQTEEIEEAFGKIKDIMGYMSDMSDYREGKVGYFDMLEKMYNLAEKYDDISLEDLWDFDSSSFKDIGDIQLDKMLDKLATELEINAYEVEDWKNHVKASFKEAEEAVSAYETASKSINLASSVSSFLSDIQSGDKGVLDLLSSAISLSEDLGVSLDDALSVDSAGKLVFNTNAITQAFETYIDDLVKAGSLNEQLAAQIKNAARAEAELADEAAETAQRMADALTNMSGFTSFISTGMSGDTDIIALLQAAQSQVDAYNEAIEKGMNGNKIDIFDLLDTSGGKVKANLESAKKRYEEIAESYVQSMIDAFRKENSDNHVLSVLNEGDWADGLTAEQASQVHAFRVEFAALIDELMKPVPPTLGDMVSDLQTMQSFLDDYASGGAVGGNFVDALEQFYSLNDKYGNGEWSFGDFFAWDDSIGDFTYKTEVLTSKVDTLAQQIVADLGLTGDAAEHALASIKASLGEAVTEYDALSNIISQVNSVNGFNEAIESYRTGDTGFLDMLSSSIEMAETFGLKIQDVFDFETMQPSAIAVTAAIDAAIDKMVEGKDYSAEFVQQLKNAARYANEVETAQKKVNDAYDKASSASSQASSYGRDTELTYTNYQELISQSSKYASAIEYVNGRLVVNKQKYWEVTQELNAETKAMALLQAQQDKLEIERLTEQLNQLADQESEEANNIRSRISDLQLEARGYELLAQELDNAADAFARFAAASDSTEGSMHSAAQEAYNIINDTLYNADSDRYGMVGNEKYKASIDLVLGDIDEASYDAAMAKLKRYFEDDKAGVKNFYTDLVNNGIIDATTGAFDTTISEISQKLGITEDAARAMMQQLEQYSKEGFDWEKLDPGSTLEDATTETKTLGEQLDETKQKATDATEAVNTLNETKADLDDEAAQTDVKTLAEGIQNCVSLIATLNAKAVSLNTSPAQSQLNRLIQSINNVVNKLRELDGKTVTVTVSKVEKSSGAKTDSGDGEASGSFVSKSWGFADARGSFRSVGGKTLVGELGRELVVDTANNRWYTVGDHGAEFVNLPKDAIVFNHLQTAQLLGNTTIRRGSSKANGNALAGGIGVTGTVQLPTDLGDTVKRGSQTVADAADETTSALEDMKDALDEANELMEHYIQHVEQEYYIHERASDYTSMQGDLMAEAQYYRKIYEQSMEAVRDMKAAGATENDEELREAEEAAWEAYQSMYDAIDKARDLLKDTLNDAIDDIQSAFGSLKDAVEEYNENGVISMDTFQSIIENGVQYLAYLRNEDGQLEINTESIRNLIQARKDQLAIETAAAYVDRIREALRNGEANTIDGLIDATNQLGTSTWNLVYAQLAMAKSEGLTEEQYQQALKNIQTLQQIASIVDEDLSLGTDDPIAKIKDSYEELNDQIDHYIKHLEQAQKVSDRFANYQGVEESITAQIQEYQRIIENCQAAIDQMKAAGADDTNEDLQAMEEAAWSAQQSIWSLHDALYSLRVDAISDRIDAIQTSIGDFQSAIDEINDTGKITIDTFQSIVDNGLQYLRFLDIENGQLSLNQESVEEMIRARKEELAVETAMSYLKQLEEALLAGEATKVAQLVGLNENLSEATWAAVYAKLALLKTEGLSDEDAAAVESYIEKLRDLSGMVDTDIAAPAVQTIEDKLGEIRDKFEEIREDLEHYIAHQEQTFTISERAMDYGGMTAALQNEVGYYSQIYEEAQKTIQELIANGADDTTAELQEVEEAAWSAYNSMNEAFDKINALRVDALNEELGRLTGMFNNLQSIIDEYNEHGAISVNSFEAILSGGIQYLTFLEKENGQYRMNTDSLRDYISARKEQLAIETAIQYLNNLRQALENGEVQRVSSLIDASNELSSSTWDLVFARAAELKTLGLTDAQYSLLIENLQKLRDMSRDVESDIGAWDKAEDPVEKLKDAFSDLNSEIEHYIAHQEQAYKESERGWNFTGMEQALQNEVGYYRRIVEEAQKTIAEMKRNGADDTSEALQNVEESQWKAANAMNEALDKIRALRVDALKNEIKNLSTSFSVLKGAAEDYNKTGGITLDTFNSIVDGGMQYLSLLDEENGQYVIAKDRLQDYVQMRKEQLAIETALSYVSELREALANRETERINRLVDATNGLSSSTWDLVYANAAALKASGLSNDQYETVIGNIDKLRALAKAVNTDLTDAGDDLSSSYKSQQDALNKILKYTEDLIRAEAKDRVQAIKDEIDAYKEIIELKKESLQQTKDENEYQEEVADKVREIAQLQAKADLLALDTSRTAGAERQKLMQEILDKQNELSKYQSDYAYEAQVEALDKEAEAYEESRQDEIKAIEESVSSEEKVYQLAIARIRDQWDTLYSDLIAWNTEQGTVINQEITDAWEEAFKALQKYGDYLSAISGLNTEINGLNGNGSLVVADIPKYHGGGVAGDKGKLNDEEVLAVLQKGELVVDRQQKKGLYTVIDFVKTLGERLGTSIGNLRNLRVSGQMMPAFAGMAAPESANVVENNNISFSPAFNVTIGGDVSDPAAAREFGQTLAKTAADSLFDRFSRRGINALQTLRQ